MWYCVIYLGASLALGLDFLLEFLNARLQFFDLLLQLSDEGLFILKLGVQRCDFLVLTLDGLLEFFLVALEVCNSFLSQLEVTFGLALVLLDVGAVL